ncbi:hypothetical protein GCM10009760_18090 [Kitasatospora kazusensis]|uniref:Heparin binding hemagglutinin HbhA n=1 Tax=Kitasatospora kazusensis TaxID=407974 RepID=A0ABP5KU91_9ACTN
MPITDEIKKTLSDPTPLYALAGAGDLAFEKLREVPGKVEALAVDRKGTQEKATARLQEAQARLVEAQSKVTETVSTLPTDFKVLQEKAQGFALQQVGRAAEFAVKAMEVYDELAVRGKAVVDKGQKSGEPQAPVQGSLSEVVDVVDVVEVVEVVEEPAETPEAEVEVETVAEVVAEPGSEETAADPRPAPKRAPRAPRARKTTAEK